MITLPLEEQAFWAMTGMCSSLNTHFVEGALESQGGEQEVFQVVDGFVGNGQGFLLGIQTKDVDAEADVPVHILLGEAVFQPPGVRMARPRPWVMS